MEQEFLAELKALLERYRITFGTFVQTPGGKLHPVSDYLPAGWPVVIIPTKARPEREEDCELLSTTRIG